MKTLTMLAATVALTLWGCAHDRVGEAQAPSMQELENSTTVARQSRVGAPTVYWGEATGGPGNAVIAGNGQIWAPEEAPGDTVLRTPSDVQLSLERHSTDHRTSIGLNGESQVIDEGPTDQAPKQ